MTVNVIGNTMVEPNETFVVNLSNAVGATIFDSQGVGTILNDDGPLLSINDVVKAEGNSGVTAFTFTVTLSPASAGTVTVTAATANGSALAGSDYTAVAPTVLTFTPGQTIKLVTVTCSANTVVEPNETFVVNLSSAVGARSVDQTSGRSARFSMMMGRLLRITDVVNGGGEQWGDGLHFTVTLSPARPAQ